MKLRYLRITFLGNTTLNAFTGGIFTSLEMIKHLSCQLFIFQKLYLKRFFLRVGENVLLSHINVLKLMF